jgi:hypothetical protein
MDSREVVRRLKAFAAGEALPRGRTQRLMLAPDIDTLVVAFLRMGGESRPWAIAWGRPDAAPEVATVPEGRNRDLVAAMCARFAPALLKLIMAPGFVANAPTQVSEIVKLRQLWLPNDSHLDMLHHLAYAYVFTSWGAGAVGRLNSLGRACGWLHREGHRPGNQVVAVATRALRDAYVFPAQDVRLGHLGYLLAWLDGSGDRRAAAEIAEQRAMSTNLDPTIEREILEPLVAAWGAANRVGDEAGMTDASSAIESVLVPEATRRWELAVKARAYLASDPRPVNQYVSELVRESLKEQWLQYSRVEQRIHDAVDGPAFVPSPETDRHPAAAGSRYFVMNASADFVNTMLVHDDRDLEAEAIAVGTAFRGQIVQVEDDGEGRSTRPVWTIMDSIAGVNRIEPGATVCVIGLPQRTAEVRSVIELANGSRQFVVEIANRKTGIKGAQGQLAVHPAHGSWIGAEVGFTGVSYGGLARRKSSKVWNDETPGAWLTHRRGGGVLDAVSDEAAENLDEIDRGMADL